MMNNQERLIFSKAETVTFHNVFQVVIGFVHKQCSCLQLNE